MRETILAMYDSLTEANHAVNDLVATGFDRSDIGLAAHDAEGRYGRYVQGESDLDDDVHGDEGAGFGALIGGLTGVVAGLTAIMIPGIGPIIAAGPLAAALGGVTGGVIGAAAGAVTGGVTASLVHLGVPEHEVGTYAEAVRRGGTLVSVTVRSDEQANEALRVLRSHNPYDVDRRATQWRKEGWTGYDDKADAYTAVDLAHDRDKREAYEDERESVQSGTENVNDLSVRRYKVDDQS
jgi:hypothetical protein